MSDELHARLRANEQRRRAERGLAERRKIAAALETAIGHRVPTTDFLSVQDSDALMEAVEAHLFRTTPQATWYGLSPLLFAGMAGWADRLDGLWGYLFADGSEFAGGARVPLALLLRDLERFWHPSAHDLDLVIATEGATDGFALEWDHDIVELRVWGKLVKTLG